MSETLCQIGTSQAEIAKSLQSWQEDFALENGNYFSSCSRCNANFIGHKRRKICRQCAIEICSQHLTKTRRPQFLCKEQSSEQP